jgi:hypothetical protein
MEKKMCQAHLAWKKFTKQQGLVQELQPKSRGSCNW